MKSRTYHVVFNGYAPDGDIEQVRRVEFHHETQTAIFTHVNGTTSVFTDVKRIQPVTESDKERILKLITIEKKTRNIKTNEESVSQSHYLSRLDILDALRAIGGTITEKNNGTNIHKITSFSIISVVDSSYSEYEIGRLYHECYCIEEV